MATVISGILSRKLPWGLVLLGVSIVFTVELLGIRSLAFAVGAYLSIGTTLAIFVGGIMRWMVDAAVKKAGGDAEAEGDVSPGSLYASGLIAAGGISRLDRRGAQVLRDNVCQGRPDRAAKQRSMFTQLGFSAGVCGAGVQLYYFARKPLKK